VKGNFVIFNRSTKIKAYEPPGRQICIRALFCLFALMAQVFLPIAHSCHICTEELLDGPESGSVYFCDRESLTHPAQAILGPHEASHHHHDPFSCSICQLVFHSHKLLLSNDSTGSVILEHVKLPPVDDCYPGISASYASGCGPRAPPLPA